MFGGMQEAGRLSGGTVSRPAEAPVLVRANQLVRAYLSGREQVGLAPLSLDELADLYILAMEAARSGR